MEKRARVIIILSLMIIAVMSIEIRAAGRSGRLEDITSEYYREAERDYKAQIREVLEQSGCDNAGIGMTKVVNETGGFDYTVSIHHRRIDRMDSVQREALSAMITDRGIPVAGSSVTVRYIEY